MTLSAASTDQQVWDEYDTCAAYEELASRDYALRFITACRIILRRRPVTAGRGDQTMTFDTIKSEMESAREWLAANPSTTSGSGGRTRFADLENFRE